MAFIAFEPSDSVVILDLFSLHFSNGIARREAPLCMYWRHSCPETDFFFYSGCLQWYGFRISLWCMELRRYCPRQSSFSQPCLALCSSQDAKRFSNAVFKGRTSTSVQRRTHARSINIDARVVRRVVWDDVMKLAWPRARQDANVNIDERRFPSVKLLRHRRRTKRCILSLLSILNTGWVSRQRTRVCPQVHPRDLKTIRMERRSLHRHRKWPR